ncbi:hypothetical protein JYB64_20495 [Algoriphagus aestuarii]|nr:hypothetical protein [Algoriphagus aestuarii]
MMPNYPVFGKLIKKHRNFSKVILGMVLLLFSCNVAIAQTGTQADPFTSIYQANSVPNGTYHFSLGGQTFETLVSFGWVMVVNETGPASVNQNLAQVTSLNFTVRGILSPNALANLGPINQARYTTLDAAGTIDTNTTNPTLLNRIKSKTTLHQGFADNSINDSWTGKGANYLTADATCVTSGGTTLPQNVFLPCGSDVTSHWIPTLPFRSITNTLGNVGDTEAFTLWVKNTGSPGGVLGSKLWFIADAGVTTSGIQQFSRRAVNDAYVSVGATGIFAHKTDPALVYGNPYASVSMDVSDYTGSDAPVGYVNGHLHTKYSSKTKVKHLL